MNPRRNPLKNPNESQEEYLKNSGKVNDKMPGEINEEIP